MTDKLIRLRDALAIVEEYVGLYDAIADLPAVTVGVDAVLDAAHEYLTQQYGASPLCHPIDRARILAALEPVAAPPVTPKVKPLDLSYVQKGAAGAFDELVPFLKTANEASREQLIVLSTNILAALEPVTQPEPAAIREAALRAGEMLRVAAQYIRDHYPDGMIHYDDADCDGYCVADDCEAAANTLVPKGAAE